MKFNTTLAIVSLLTCFSVFTSCTKEGCTNPNAVNYDVDATEDDGTCELEREKFLGNYATSRSCVYESDSTYSINIIEGPKDSEIIMQNLYGWSENLRATVVGTEFSFKDEAEGVTFEGNGYFAGNELIIKTTVCETFYYPCDDPDDCTSTCIKQ